jgi:hypothetical protein
MKKLLIIAVVLVCSGVWLRAQGDLNEQQKVFFRNEKSLGILLNSDGLGLSYREGKRINFLNKSILEFDLGTLKHPKEYKMYNPWTTGTGSYVYGKLNSVVFLRAGLGHQHEIYKKEDLGGVAIRYFFSAGPVIALVKPIYYRIIYTDNYNITLKDEKFDIKDLPTDIYSRASFTKGFSEIKAFPGLYAKGGFNFEYSKEDKVIHAIELGAQINAFPKKIPIMYGSNNKAIYFSLFVSYRFGVIVDPLHPEDTKLANLFKRRKQAENNP